MIPQSVLELADKQLANYSLEETGCECCGTHGYRLSWVNGWGEECGRDYKSYPHLIRWLARTIARRAVWDTPARHQAHRRVMRKLEELGAVAYHFHQGYHPVFERYKDRWDGYELALREQLKEEITFV